MRKFKKGDLFFTLLELLVVVAILMILMSVLLPALSKARESAGWVKCMGNLKQLGAVAMMYIGDYNDLPLYWDGSRTWTSRFDATGHIKWSRDGKWMYCPSYIPGGQVDAQGLPATASLTYAINAELNGVRKIAKPPSVYPIYLDSRQDASPNFQWYYCYVGTANSGHSIHMRHNGQANIWFYDGHAALMNRGVLNSLGIRNMYP